MKRNLLLLFLVVGANMQAVQASSDRLTQADREMIQKVKIQEEIQACRRWVGGAKNRLHQIYNKSCLERVKKKYPGKVEGLMKPLKVE